MVRHIAAVLGLALLTGGVVAARKGISAYPPGSPSAPFTGAGESWDPVADSAAVVVAGDARFTVLSPYLIRMEEQRAAGTDATWRDTATLAIVNRRTPVDNFTTTNHGDGSISIVTSVGVTLRYYSGYGFNSTSLSITSPTGVLPVYSWRYGDDAVGDGIFGTIRSLDDINTISLNCTLNAGIEVHDESLHCENSLFSRGGWRVFSDDHSASLNDTTGWWSNVSTPVTKDVYFFGHGWNYQTALQDYASIGGRIPMLPRYALGIARSRWYDMSSLDTKNSVFDYSSRDIPLDTWVWDMDWHISPAWGAYTWDNNDIPIPADTIEWLQRNGLHVSLNFHDDSGVASDEAEYVPMAKANGINPASNTTVPFDISSQTYATSLENIVMKPLWDAGVSIAWIDWQQGGTPGISVDNLNPTIGLNALRTGDQVRWGNDERAWVLARWGGLGNHRYQAGFSGDVRHNWTSLAFAPYFSVMGTNVLYPYWSNDLVSDQGHDTAHQEIFTRTIQWGSYSPIFRIHDAGAGCGSCADDGGCALVQIWDQEPLYFEAARTAMVERHQLLPYLYTLAREAYDTGLGAHRHMYYARPDADEAYAQIVNNQQYMIGGSMVVSPITAPAPAATRHLSNPWPVWLPSLEVGAVPGTSALWYDVHGTMLLDTSTFNTSDAYNLTRTYDIREIPTFVAGGSIITRIPHNPADTLGVANRAYSHLQVDVYPGGTSGSTRLYEDDGHSLGYSSGAYATTTISYTRSASTTTVSVGAQESPTNGYGGQVTTRTGVLIRLHLSAPAVTVTVTRGGGSGETVPFDRFAAHNATAIFTSPLASWWTYDAYSGSVDVFVPGVATAQALGVTVTHMSGPATTLNGLGGCITRAAWSKANLDEAVISPVMKTGLPILQQIAVAGEVLEVLAGGGSTGADKFFAAAGEVAANWGTMVDEVGRVTTNATRRAYSVGLVEGVEGYCSGDAAWRRQ